MMSSETRNATETVMNKVRTGKWVRFSAVDEAMIIMSNIHNRFIHSLYQTGTVTVEKIGIRDKIR